MDNENGKNGDVKGFPQWYKLDGTLEDEAEFVSGFIRAYESMYGEESVDED